MDSDQVMQIPHCESTAVMTVMVNGSPQNLEFGCGQAKGHLGVHRVILEWPQVVDTLQALVGQNAVQEKG